MLQRGRFDAPPDEDEPRAPVLVGPRVKVDRRVDDVLDAVQEKRPRTADIEESLHAQDVLTSTLEQHRQPDAKGAPVELLVQKQHGGGDLVVAVTVLDQEVAGIALRPAEQAYRL